MLSRSLAVLGMVCFLAGCAANIPREYNDQGVFYQKKGLYDQAIAEYTRAIGADPRYALAYYNRGRAYFEKEQYDRALADYDKRCSSSRRTARPSLTRRSPAKVRA